MRNLLRCMYSDTYYATSVSYPDTLLHLAEWNSTVQEIYNLCAQVWLDGKRESHCSHGGYYATTTTTPWGFQRWQCNGQWSLKNLNAWWNKAVRSWAEVLSSTNSFEQTCIVNFSSWERMKGMYNGLSFSSIFSSRLMPFLWQMSYAQNTSLSMKQRLI